MFAPYATLINLKLLIPSPRTQYVAVDKDHLVDFLKPTLRQIYVDEGWYLKAHPDVAEAIAGGIVKDAKDHYVCAGYYEHRMPYEIEVDGDWYLSQYEDVRAAVKSGMIETARHHFYAAGFREGRLPSPGFTFTLVQHGTGPVA